MYLSAELFADRTLTFGHISQAGVIQNIGDGIADIAHRKAQAAGLFVRAAAGFVSRLAHASDGRHGTIQHTEDLTEGDLFGRPGQVIPAADPHLTVQHPGVLERKQDLLKELGGDLLALGDLFDLHHLWGRVFFSGFSQCDHGPQAILAAFGKPHTLSVTPSVPIDFIDRNNNSAAELCQEDLMGVVSAIFSETTFNFS